LVSSLVFIWFGGGAAGATGEGGRLSRARRGDTGGEGNAFTCRFQIFRRFFSGDDAIARFSPPARWFVRDFVYFRGDLVISFVMLLFIKLGFFDIIDILLVAFIFFQLYRLVKGTVAINIFAGIFTFYLAWLLVKAFNMELISSILGQFIGMGVIALLIVFQQEVRHFLLLIGNKYNLQNIFNLERFLAKPPVNDGVVDSIVAACGGFARSKTGALIVLARNSELFAYAQTGVILRSAVSEELLGNIFFKNSPLHDGAVIVADNKLLAARCILPVSDRTDIPGSLGLRHRAAIGLSALTDAYVVVVSEETGHVTFVKGGEFKTRLTPAELKDLLQGNLTAFPS
jgi:uncharacterized protein (TIGR00159 family)